MTEGLQLLVIAVGGEIKHPDNRELVGRDFYHFIRDGEKVIPVFTTPERFREYVRVSIVEGDAHGYMDMMVGGDAARARALAEEHFTGIGMSVPELRDYAERVGADLIILDPRPGESCKAWRV